MSTQSAGVPTESDVVAVEQRLSALWTDLTPAQQEILDTIICTGLSVVSASEDTQGYIDMANNPLYMEEHIRSRTAELREDYRRANFQRENPEAEAGPRWSLRPVLNWFQRAPAPQQRPGGAPA